MAVTNSDWESILQYIQKRIKESGNVNIYIDELNKLTYESWKEWKSKQKKLKAKLPVTEYDQQWNEFWSGWPRIRTVKELGSKGICNKDFRGAEAKMKDKYIRIVTSGKITAEEMNYAAKSYIANGIADSIRLNRNELEFRSGMEPWMNQEKYLTWKDIPLPVKQKESSIYTEA